MDGGHEYRNLISAFECPVKILITIDLDAEDPEPQPVGNTPDFPCTVNPQDPEEFLFTYRTGEQDRGRGPSW
jgi:hypothetical protein